MAWQSGGHDAVAVARLHRGTEHGDDVFASDHGAYADFEPTDAEEGKRTFLDKSTVMRFRRR